MTPKELKKLADMCRKAGIKHYKQGDIEFTLTEDAPVKSKKTVSQSNQSASNVQNENGTFESDSPSEEDLLFWSVGIGQPTESKENQ